MLKLKPFCMYSPKQIAAIFNRTSFISFFILLIFSTLPSIGAADMNGGVLRNYPTAMLLEKGRLEFSLDYQSVNDTIDVLGVREDEYAKLSSADRATTPGDLWGGRLLVNYGLFKGTTLMSAFQYRNQDYGYDSMGVKTLDLGFKQRLFNEDYLLLPKLVLNAGIRINSADDTLYDDETEINAIIQRMRPGTSVRIRIAPYFVWFDKTSDGDQFSLGVPRQGRPDPKVSLGDLQDISPYLRLTGGWIWGRFFPNLFVEGGHTEIRSQIDTTLAGYIPESYKDDLPRFPIDLSRSENYIKTGVNLLIRCHARVLLNFEYDYLRLFREEGLEYMQDNHIFKADVNLYLTPDLVFNLGGTYFQRQLNGEIPFLYNEFTQTTFDHPYGYAHIGLTYSFGSK